MDEFENEAPRQSAYGELPPEQPSVVPVTENTFARRYDVRVYETTPQEWVKNRSREQMCGNSISDATWNTIMDKELIQVFEIYDQMYVLHAVAVAHRDDVRPQSNLGATRLMFVCTPPQGNADLWLLAVLAVLEYAIDSNNGRVILRLPRGAAQVSLGQILGEIFNFALFRNDSDPDGVWYEAVSNDAQVVHWSGILQQRLRLEQLPDPQGDLLPGDLEFELDPNPVDPFGDAAAQGAPPESPLPPNGRRRLPRHAPEGKFWCGRHKSPEEPEAMEHDVWRIRDDLSIVRDPTRQIGRPLRHDGTPFQCWKSGLHSGGGKTRQRPAQRR